MICSNFTFDEVYLGLCESDELDNDIHQMVQQIVNDYRCADLLIRLPGAIRIPSFDDTTGIVPTINTSTSTIAPIQNSSIIRHIIDVPLVFRKCHLPRELVLEQLGIPKEVYTTSKVLLLSFGGQLLGNDDSLMKQQHLPPNWICIVCAAPDNVEMPPSFYRAPKDAYVPDLTNACDVLLGKLGYGTCSECIGLNTPLVYVPRPQFIEERGLLTLMEGQGCAVELSQQDFEEGNWAPTIEKAMKSNCPKKVFERNGSEVAAKTIESFVAEWYGQKQSKIQKKAMSLVDVVFYNVYY